MKLVCRCSEIKFASDGQNQQRQAQPQAGRNQAQRTRQRTQQQEPERTVNTDFDSYDDDIPFADPYRGTRCLIC
ncbi:hypothetical protein [Pseudomonas sp. S9]|uniref:hypothetical protein n=1 Tax=Pseudomonas sp. S9 TaxID=686578 RepID=UPI0002556DCD|nr:hypothetical protein [Pseudomonas sp. S9]